MPFDAASRTNAARQRTPNGRPLQRHLPAPTPAGRAALADRLLRRVERLGEPATEWAGRLAGAPLADADHLVPATLRTVGQSRREDREDEQQDTEGGDTDDDHATL